jgi:hypothetical protein
MSLHVGRYAYSRTMELGKIARWSLNEAMDDCILARSSDIPYQARILFCRLEIPKLSALDSHRTHITLRQDGDKL